MELDIQQAALAGFATKEVLAPERGVPLAEVDHESNEVDQRCVTLDQGPIKPAELVVLQVRVIVPLLSAPALVARKQHGYALRQQQNCEKIPDPPCPKLFDSRVWARPLEAAVVARLVLVV